MNKLYKIALITIIIVISSASANAQLFKEYFFGMGIITSSILGDNPARKPIVNPTSDGTQVFGGSYNLNQSGIDMRLTLPINEKFDIPISLDYLFYTAKELNPISFPEVQGADTITVLELNKFHNKLNFFGVSAGLHYKFAHIDIANAYFYTGLELKMNYIHSYSFTHEIENLTFPNRSREVEQEPKENALRFGALYRLGVYGRLHKNWDVNISGSLNVVNLFTKDNSRGELLTPTSLFVNKESTLYTANLSFLIQYRFNQPKPIIIEEVEL
jgi:hypothetical protein